MFARNDQHVEPTEIEIQLKTAPASFYTKYNPAEITAMPNGDVHMGTNPIIKIQQSEIVFTSRTTRVVASSGAGPCIIFAVRHRSTKQGFMAHIFTAAEIIPFYHCGKWLLNRIDELYATAPNGILDVYMVGGWRCLSTAMEVGLQMFVAEMEKKYKIGLVSKQLHQNWVSNVVLDFDDGKIYDYESKHDLSYQRDTNILQGLITSYLNFSIFSPSHPTTLFEHTPEPTVGTMPSSGQKFHYW